MGLIKYSGLLTGIWGKLNGTVFTKNKSGAIIKNKQTPTNPNSQVQTQNRSSLSNLSRKWRQLSEAQRIDWNDFALSIILYNYWGDSYSPSGFNLFCRLNQNLFLINESGIDDPPATPSVEPLVNPTLDDIVIGTNSIKILFPAQTSDADTIHLIYSSPAISCGIFYNKSNFKIIGMIPALTANSYDCYIDFISKYPRYKLGQKIFMKLRAVSISRGFDNWNASFNKIVLSSVVPLGIGSAVIGTSLIIT